ncbi:SDR family NAD(P)-dependent oxidoreductase [Hoeflea sp. YIM 152468]|uniref:SDR family NAD(P)-dependent oxidoreductase n=1 Tax=Hoeflea sp. YIM 152468 TaxID=3031759 RepID=UPI0023DB3CE8|nr:SDR family NAD(P)-dependent oxidoreductase [Hoeflea sp. YIM 152468]MDF1609863.1 SDR family NAD(P)-dependent oxidoreductase [Hoeflea sp. YIM 152468]
MMSYTATPSDGSAWVTGASSGIGRALALDLARAGFAVYATARSKDALADLEGLSDGLEGRIIAAPGDVTETESMAEIAAHIDAEGGGLALAVFNAGVYLPVHGETLKVADFDARFAVNLSGVVNGLVPTIDRMKARGRGQIAIVSSVTGYGGMPTSAAYGATKAALINMAESLKFDLDKIGIRIQVINPGFVDTPATQDNAFAMPALLQPEDASRRIAKGLKSASFEVTFPRRFTYVLKLLQCLPYPAYFALMNAATGWKRRPLETGGDQPE